MINPQTANKNHYVQTYNRPLNYQQLANQQHVNQQHTEPVKTMHQNNVQANEINEQTQQVQRKLFSFFYIYAILIISLYVTYAAYYFYQHQMKRQQQQQQFPHQPIDIYSTTTPEDLVPMSQSEHQAQMRLLSQNDSPELVEEQKNRLNFESKFESKIHLLERYIEVIALDLQETKNRLKEREKCDCNLSCSFNGTKYAENSSWQNQCDVCTCQSGRISCLPKKCPPTNCDDAIQLPGQCCPSCMRKCKYNNTIIRHGHKFKPSESSGKSTKECKCFDGLIRCELPIQRFLTTKESKTNSTMVKAIIAAENKSKLNAATASATITTTILKALNSTNSIHPITKQTIS